MSLRRSTRCLALLACLATSAAPAADALIVLTVDIEYLESGMPLYAAIADQAELAQRSVDGMRRSEIELARDLRQSEVLTALPEAIAAYRARYAANSAVVVTMLAELDRTPSERQRARLGAKLRRYALDFRELAAI